MVPVYELDVDGESDADYGVIQRASQCAKAPAGTCQSLAAWIYART